MSSNDVLRVGVAGHAIPCRPGLMFVECQRGRLLGAPKPVVVAPNRGVALELRSLMSILNDPTADSRQVCAASVLVHRDL